MIGSRSGVMHRLGDSVEVRLVEAAPVAGALRFELLSEGAKAPKGPRSRPGGQGERRKEHASAAFSRERKLPHRGKTPPGSGRGKKGKRRK
jgi:ribonuclease R